MDTTVDFTKGKIGKLILGFYFPLLATNMLQQIYSFVDAAIVGKGIGDNALGSVGNMSSLTFLIMGFSMGLSNGISIIIAQNFGEKDMEKLRRSFSAAIQTVAVLTVVLTAVSLLFLKYTLVSILQIDKVLMNDALRYGYIIFGGLFATFLYNMSSGVLRALGDSRTPLKAIIISSFINIILDSVLIFIFRTGVEGAAAATVFSQVVSGFVCIMKLKKIEYLKLSKADIKIDIPMYAILLKNGIPMALMNSITAVGCMVVQRFINELGPSYSSAYAACSKYLNLFMTPACTAGNTMSAFSSQNYGAKEFDRIKKGLFDCLLIAFISYLILGSAMVFLAKPLASIMLNGEEQISLAAQFLPICGVMIFGVDFLFVVRSTVQGMGFPFVPMCSGIAEMLLRVFVIVLFIDKYGFIATPYAEISAWYGALFLNTGALIFILSRESKKYAKKEPVVLKI